MATTVQFCGEQFTLNDTVSEFALMEFASAAADGGDADTMQGMASMLRLIQDCIIPEDWMRFRTAARKNRVAAADLMPVLNASFEQAAGHPTGRSSDSSDGPASIDPKPVSSSAAKASGRFAGRPDLALAVIRTRGDKTAVA